VTEAPRAELEAFLVALDADVSYAVAKQPDLWKNLRQGGDWDLVVPDVTVAQRILVAHLGPPARTVRRSYVVANYFEWGEIDLLPGIEWKGIELVSAGCVVERASRTSDGHRVACLAHQVVAAWIYPMLAHGSFHPRYTEVVGRALLEDGAELERILARVFGGESARVLRAAHAGRPADIAPFIPSLRRAVRRRALVRTPRMTSRAIGSFVLAEARIRARRSAQRLPAFR